MASLASAHPPGKPGGSFSVRPTDTPDDPDRDDGEDERGGTIGAAAHLIVLDALGDAATLGPLLPDAAVESAAGIELAEEGELERLADLRAVTLVVPGDAGPQMLARIRAARARVEPFADTIRTVAWPGWPAAMPLGLPAGLDSPGARLAWLLALPDVEGGSVGSVSSVSDPMGGGRRNSGPGAASGGGSVSSVSDPMGGIPEFSGPPRPIVTVLRPVPEFDPELLPIPLRAWVVDIADRMQCAIEYPAVAAIIALATVIGRKVAIRPKRHDIWTVVANLWGVIVGRPGVLKSPALEEAMRPLKRLVADAADRHKAAVAVHGRTLMVAGARRDGAKENLKKAAKRGASDDDLRRLADEAAAAEEGGGPVLKRYLTNDPNAASLGELLRDNPDGILVYRDELQGFLRSLDRQGSEGDRSFYLEGWNGNGAFDQDRIGRGHVRIEAVCLSVLGGIQPGPLAAYLRAAVNGQGDDGLISRFQLAVYPDRLDQFRIVDRAPDVGAKNRAYGVFKALDDLDPADLGCEADDHSDIPYIRLHEDAQILFYSWLKDLQMEKLSGDEPEALESHFSKYRSLMPSLALIFHVIDVVDGAARGPVSLDAARKAAAWCDLLEEHARRIYQAGGDGDMGPARGLAAKLTQSLPSPFRARDVLRKQWSGLTTTVNVEHALGVLEEHGWVRPVEVPTGPKGGQPTVDYYINPEVGGGGA